LIVAEQPAFYNIFAIGYKIGMLQSEPIVFQYRKHFIIIIAINLF